MKQYEKEVIQAQLDNEKAVLKKLEANYKDALDEVNDRIAMLLGRQDADLQHVVYQVEFQKSLKTQIQSILEQLQNNEFETVSEYLTQSYEEGFLGTMYSLQSQGVPLVFPIDQEQVVAAIQNETKLSESLYNSLGKDVKQLNKQIAGEISRGISNAAMYSEIARNIAGYARIPKNNAMRIARTEAHRIQNKATMDACVKAKEKGADVLRQWDATFDGSTRPNHRELDGQLRELDEPFEVAGKKAMFPGDFGDPAEDCNCRCSLLQRARWNLDSDITKWTKEYGIVTIKAKDYQAFKEEYFRQVDAGSVRQSTQKIKNQARANDIFLVGDDLPKNPSITPEAVLTHLGTSDIGKETLAYLESVGVKPKLIYSKQSHSNRGEQRGNVIEIFMANIQNDRVAAQTIIHEVTHLKYGIGGCQWAEAVCMAHEKMHKEGRNYLTPNEKRYILELARDAYPEYKWKKGGYKNGKKL